MKNFKVINRQFEIDKEMVYGRHHSAHLIHTYKILKEAKCDSVTSSAGLLHSLYDDNPMYSNKGASYSDRELVKSLVGNSTERLIYLYSHLHRIREFNNIKIIQDKVFIITTNERIELTLSEIKSISNIFIADVIEQIIWCVEHKKIFSFSDSYEHLVKLTGLIKYSNPELKELYHFYWGKACDA